jgi:hypothetical protein
MALLSRRDRQHSYEIITDPAMPSPEEHDGFTCAHCGVNQRLKPMKVVGNVMSDEANEALAGRCTCCDKLICLNCVGKGCTPLQAQMEKWERRKEYGGT